MRSIASHAGVDGEIYITVVDVGSLRVASDTCHILLGGGNGSVNTQIAHLGSLLQTPEDGAVVFHGISIHLDAVSLSVESSLVVIRSLRTYHRDICPQIDVSGKHRVGRGVTTLVCRGVHERGKGQIVLQRANLIDTVLLVECPCRAAHDCHDSHKT